MRLASSTRPAICGEVSRSPVIPTRPSAFTEVTCRSLSTRTPTATHFAFTSFLETGTNPFLFRGGFLVTSIATMMLIAAVTHPYTLSARWLGSRPIVWVGTRSYGLYLYSWPIFEILRDPSRTGLTGNQFAIGLPAIAGNAGGRPWPLA